MRTAIILGTRPEIIKFSPIVRECKRRKAPFFVINTNQHYSADMSDIFFRELELPVPKYNLHIGTVPGGHGAQTGAMLAAIEDVLKRERPGIVLVQGDTNTALAGALAAAKMGIKVGHVEAGLRSYDRTMPEEVNRVAIDHVSDLLFPPTKMGADTLAGEGIAKKKIAVTGNTVVDAVRQNVKLAERKSNIVDLLGAGRQPYPYLLLTLHRPANVDDRKTFSKILEGLAAVMKHSQMPIIFPIHPRTRKMMKRFGIKAPQGLRAIDPVGYFDFLALEEHAQLILTDSGGIQEEACILKIPCVTIRNNTERPETVAVGANRLAGMEPKGILAAFKAMEKRPRTWKNPLGKGDAAARIMEKVLYNTNHE